MTHKAKIEVEWTEDKDCFFLTFYDDKGKVVLDANGDVPLLYFDTVASLRKHIKGYYEGLENGKN